MTNYDVRSIQIFIIKSFSEVITLMNHRMPIKNGIETTKEILQIDNTSKFIFLSADQSI